MARPRKQRMDEGVEDNSRRTQTRTAQSRSSTMRQMPQDSQQAATFIPKHLWPKGYTLRWGRLSTQGAPDDKNWSEMIRKGWRPVTRSDSPQLNDLYPSIPMPGMDQTAGDNIIIGGLIAMKRPTRDVLRDKEDQAIRTIEANESIQSWVESGTPGARFNESSPVEFSRAVPQDNAAFKPEDDPVVGQ